MKYRIWSNEHNAWWKDNFCGYTQNIEDAGVYELDQIKKNYSYLIKATPKNKDFLVPVIDEKENKEE